MNIKMGGRLLRTWRTYTSGPVMVGYSENRRNLCRWPMRKRHNPPMWSSLAGGRKAKPTQVVDSLYWRIGGRRNLHRWSWLGLVLKRTVFGSSVIGNLGVESFPLEPRSPDTFKCRWASVRCR